MPENNDQNELFQPIDESETELCSALWMAVALQAVVDSRSKSSKPKIQRDKEEALQWLNADNHEENSLAYVCQMAGLDFKKTQQRLLEIVNSPDETVDFRCVKKALMDNRGIEDRSKYLKRIRRQKNAHYIRQAKELAKKAILQQQ